MKKNINLNTVKIFLKAVSLDRQRSRRTWECVEWQAGDVTVGTGTTTVVPAEVEEDAVVVVFR